MTPKMLITAVAVATATLGFTSVRSDERPQTPVGADHEQHHPPAAPQAGPQGPARPGMMTGMAEMQAMDKKLDELVQRMQSATGPAKVDAIAEVVTALVAQHKDMHSRMSGMPMMQQMNR